MRTHWRLILAGVYLFLVLPLFSQVTALITATDDLAVFLGFAGLLIWVALFYWSLSQFIKLISNYIKANLDHE